MSDCGCTKAKEQLEEYLRHELGPELAADVNEHLAGCEDCSDEARIRTVITDVVRRSCDGDVAPAELRDRVMHALRAESH